MSLPPLAQQDSGYLSLTDTVLVGNLLLAHRSTEDADLFDLNDGQAGIPIHLPTGALGGALRIAPTLGRHIAQVVRLRPDEQVIGSYARWVVAVVADEQAIRHRSEVEFPGCNVGANLAKAPSSTDDAIARGVPTGANPHPAIVRFLHLWPETISQGDALWTFRHDSSSMELYQRSYLVVEV